jgi:hypothetical protein
MLKCITMENGGRFNNMRRLPESFINDLKNEDGILNPLLERIKKDDTLLLSIRNNYVNIYYRGGNLVRISCGAKGYKAFFDKRYNKTDIFLPKLPDTINDVGDTESWIAAFPTLKQTMDISFSINSKPEREFQQLIARENNNSTISNETEYFITDIEFSDSEIREVRFDLLAIRWLASQRRKHTECLPVFIELKYGDGALNGSAGLIKHLEDLNRILSDQEQYAAILETMEKQFEQLGELGLVKYKQPANFRGISLNPQMKPEVIIVLANHNPRSRILADILSSNQMKDFEDPTKFYLKFFVASFAGYGFHADTMFTLPEIKERLNSGI